MTNGQFESPAAPNSPRGSINRLEELSYAALDRYDRSRTVVIFSVSPLEEHGTHLPAGTDLFEAEYFSGELAARIVDAKPGWEVLRGPSLPLGASAFDHAGTLRARARTVRNITVDYGASLARHGFKYILVMNAHAGPRHVVALEEAASVVSRRYAVRMLSVSGPILWKLLRGNYSARLSQVLGRPVMPEEQEAMRGDAHAGLWETSLLLKIRPDLVDPEYRELPPQRFPLRKAVRRNYPLRYGNRKGYIGSPAAANISWADAAREVLLDEAWQLVSPMLDPSNKSWQKTSLLFKIPVLRTDFPYVFAAGLLGAAALGFAALGTGALLWSVARWRRS
jgi:creatinine amidohydrolase